MNNIKDWAPGDELLSQDEQLKQLCDELFNGKRELIPYPKAVEHHSQSQRQEKIESTTSDYLDLRSVLSGLHTFITRFNVSENFNGGSKVGDSGLLFKEAIQDILPDKSSFDIHQEILKYSKLAAKSSQE